MPRRTQHQLIWTTTENGAELRLPKSIKTDIGFQLMFGFKSPSVINKSQSSLKEVNIDELKLNK